MEKLQVFTPIAILAGSVLIASAIAIPWTREIEQRACTALSRSAEVAFGKAAFHMVNIDFQGQSAPLEADLITVMEAVHGTTFENCMRR